MQLIQVKVRPRQSVFDIAVQLYKNIEGIPLLLNGSLSDITDLSAFIDIGKIITYDADVTVANNNVQGGSDTVTTLAQDTIRPLQSFFDIAAQLYGNIEGMPLLLSGSLSGITDLSAVLTVGAQINYDADDTVTKKNVLKGMDNKIVFTYPTNDNPYEDAEYNTDFAFDFTS
jgi:hypothetical protein